jgi:hypothetical protein
MASEHLAKLVALVQRGEPQRGNPAYMSALAHEREVAAYQTRVNALSAVVMAEVLDLDARLLGRRVPVTELCEARLDEFVCTRARGHQGRHEAKVGWNG